MKTIKLIYLMLLLLTATHNYAQDYVPSPQTWDFMANGRVPVKLYTGQLDLQIPIYTYKDKDFEIPVSLSYNSAGFVPGKPAGPAGLNWSLNAGGVITRTVQGAPDERQLYRYSNDESGYNGLWYGLKSWPGISCNNNTIFNFGSPGKEAYSPNGFWGWDIVDPSSSMRRFETRSDIYEFNFLGHSGKFIIGWDRKVKVFGCKGSGTYQVDLGGFNAYDASGIVITTGDGYRYYFGGSPSSTEFVYGASEKNFYGANYFCTSEASRTNVSWYLTRVEAPNGRTATFNYRQYEGGGFYDLITSEIENGQCEIASEENLQNGEFWIATKTKAYVSGVSSYDNLSTFLNEYSYTRYVSNNEYSQYLKTVYLENIIIDESDGQIYPFITINYSPKQNKDFPGNSYATKNLKIDNIRLQRQYFEVVKEFTFEYIYGSNRMFLDKVNVPGDGFYKFGYGGINSLPAATTNAIDHWGFWTGGTSVNQSLVPQYLLDENTGDVISIKAVNGVPGGKEPNHTASSLSAGLLTRVTYPTGGGTQVEYEQHEYRMMLDRRSDYNFMPKLYTYDQTKAFYNGLLQRLGQTSHTRYENTMNYAGGVRVKKISDFLNGVTTNVREYTYKTGPNGENSGILMSMPRYVYHIHHGNPYYNNTKVESSGISINSYDKEYICYSSVMEKDYGGYRQYEFSTYASNPDDTTQNRRRIQSFSVFDFLPSSFYVNIYRQSNSHEAERGLLLRESIFDSVMVKKKRSIYNYNYIDPNNFVASIALSGNYWYSKKTYPHSCILTSSIDSVFDGSVAIETRQEYTYNPQGLVSSEKVTDSQGNLYQSSYLYPADFGATAPYNEMVAANILEWVVEKKDYKNGGLLMRKVNSYEKWHSKFFALSKVEEQKNGFPLETRLNYKYNEMGNPVEIIKDNADKTVYLWGYHYLYPVVEVRNATYDQVKSVIRGGEQKIKNMENALISLWSFQSDGDLQSLLPGSQVSYYSYLPMAGMDTKTDPRGVETVFDYDAFGRLIKTTYGGKVMSEYEYKYKN